MLRSFQIVKTARLKTWIRQELWVLDTEHTPTYRNPFLGAMPTGILVQERNPFRKQWTLNTWCKWISTSSKFGHCLLRPKRPQWIAEYRGKIGYFIRRRLLSSSSCLLRPNWYTADLLASIWHFNVVLFRLLNNEAELVEGTWRVDTRFRARFTSQWMICMTS